MGIHADYAGCHYLEDLDFSHEVLDGYVSLHSTAVDGRTDAHSLTVDGNANFRKMRSYDGFNGWSIDIRGNTDFSNAYLEELFLRSGQTGGNLIGKSLQVEEDIDLKRFSAEHIMLQEAQIGGTLYLEDTDTEYIDIRGATIPRLWADDLDRYEFRVDENTWIGEVREGYGLTADPDQSPKEQEFVDRVFERPLFPVDKRDGALFTYDGLKKDFVMNEERQGLLGSLSQKGIVQSFDEEQYVLVTRQYD